MSRKINRLVERRFLIESNRSCFATGKNDGSDGAMKQRMLNNSDFSRTIVILDCQFEER